MILALGMAAMMANAKPFYTMENTYPRVMAIKEIDAGEDGEYWTEDDIALCIDAVGMKWNLPTAIIVFISPD